MHPGSESVKHQPHGPQFPRYCIEVRIVALDGAPLTPRCGHAHEELEFTVSVAIGLQLNHQQPIVRNQTKRPPFSAALAQIVACSIAGINTQD